MRFDNDCDVLDYMLKKEFGMLLKLSRTGDEESQKNLLWLLDKCGIGRYCIEDKFCPTAEDEHWISALAENLYVPALKVYLEGTACTFKRWMEDFIDEETNEVVSVEREEIVEAEPLYNVAEKKKQELVQKYFDYIYAHRNDSILLKKGIENLSSSYDGFALCGIYSDRAPQYVEMLEKLAEKDDALKWNKELASLYYGGLPQLGIFRNNEKSKAYYQQAITSGDCSRNWEEENKYLNEPYEFDEEIRRYNLIIKGTEGQFTCIKTLVNELCQEFGIPENEYPLGMYVPLDTMIQTLVGSDEYQGNLLSMDINNVELTLDIESEDEAPEALRYALTEAFGPMEIAIEEKEF